MLKKLSKDQELKLLAKLTERELLMEMRTSFQGLSEEDAAERLAEYGPNKVDAQKTNTCLVDDPRCFQRSFCVSFGIINGYFFCNRRY